MISIFTAPKPFTNPHIAIIQRNAIRSWKAIGADVILVGDEEGIAEAARDLDVRHEPCVVHNTYGTPKIDSIFELGRKAATGDLLAYINADIILLPDFTEAAESVAAQQSEFLIIGQRWDLDVKNELDFTSGWSDRLKAEVQNRARRHPRGGSDYFLFPRSIFTMIPAFAIGRAGWDNWMIYEARRQKWKVIDGSTDINIIHQDHDYSHLPDGKPHYRLPETFENIEMAGGKRAIFTLDDCDYRLENDRLERLPLTWRKFWREVEILPLVSWHSRPLGEVFFAIFHPVKAYHEWRTKTAVSANR
ncbi:MAG: glycosyltransferase family 2 protein [Leptolinea sp.]|jgi:hypothetical protein|nr:glycosyltransferase family 2 protein [Leptolinea sp.]